MEEEKSKSEDQRDDASTADQPQASNETDSVGDAEKEQSHIQVLPGEPAFPIVGIGASAGGLAAYEDFFANIAPELEDEIAFVLVQHLGPDHKSILVDLVSRCTRMKVLEVKDGVKVEPGRAYVIPPNRDMALMQGKLYLMEPTTPRGLRLPIDNFFRSLALDQGERAIGIVLSGTGTDGTLGLRAIKETGGLTIVQDPESAQYSGMPQSVINNGLADYILPPAKMPEQLLAYTRHAFGMRVKPVVVAPPPDTAELLQKILILLRDRTGHDFSHYKRSTIQRRIERRMAINQIESIAHYLQYLETIVPEIHTLFRELLIGVTSFFRDPAAFEALQNSVLPKLFTREAVRVWVPGCSTGEEAFSIAMLLQEHMTEARSDVRVQIFGTDIDQQAIQKARAGVYPHGIAADVSPERLARFFEPEDDSYRIKKTIRDMVILAEQNVVKDPPFSKIDLISCRNLLIYLDTELQRRVLPMFHYALNTGGFLFLGNSETTGNFVEHFALIDKKWKIYQRRGEHPSFMETLNFIPPLLETAIRARRTVGEEKTTMNVRDVTEKLLLQNFAPACVTVDKSGNILYVHGHADKYLGLATGDVSVNVLKMAREGLSLELTTGLRQATTRNEPVRRESVWVKTNGESQVVNLTINPIGNKSEMLMIIFEPVTSPSPPTPPVTVEGEATDDTPTDVTSRIATLERNLRAKEEHLQTVIEELESANEELKSANEELQSSNEELKSTNEEMETSKEELQLLNEELATVNAELQGKIDQLSQANSDINSLMAASNVGTMLVSNDLKIQRYTPNVPKVINLIPSDIGRPLTDLSSNFVEYDRLVEDVQSVLETLIPYEVKVKCREGQWYLMRIYPYRTVKNVIAGAVITFVEITELKRTQEQLFEQNDILALAPVLVRDLDSKIISWNRGMELLCGYTSDEAIGHVSHELLRTQFPAPRTQIEKTLLKQGRWAGELTHTQKDGRQMIAASLWIVHYTADGKPQHVLEVNQYITNLRQKK